tara:strand:+ start:873 stop:1469 length:597 start_codon:yes stop_codon:yes gene_type:complete
MAITVELIKDLRQQSGAGIMDCKQALSKTDGNLEKAVDLLRKKGLAMAAKKKGRATSEGSIGSYIHAGSKIGVMVEVNCETDFVAKTDEFQSIVKDIAMHIAAADPRYISREDVSQDVIDREKEIFSTQAKEGGKPEKIIDRIVEGKIEKFYGETCLLEQPFIKDTDQTIKDFLAKAIAKLGENMSISRFVRYQVGQD